MLKSKVGYSINADPYQAGIETAKMATDGIKGKFAFVFNSAGYDQVEFIKGIKKATPKLSFVGCTSFDAIIVPDGVITSENGFAGMLAFDGDISVSTAAAAKSNDARKTGAKVAMDAMKASKKRTKPDYFFMSANPAEEEEYLKGIQDVIGRVPFFGGSAADNDLSGKWKVFHQDGITNDGVAVAFFYTDKEVVTTYTGAYRETTDVGVITKVSGNRILEEIDNIKAVEKYASWRKMDTKDLMGGALLTATITSPLGVKDRLGDLAVIRHPMGGNEDLSMNIGNKLAVGTAVVRMEATVDELVESTKNTLNETKEKLNDPAAYMLIHCGGRKIGIGNRINEVHANLKEVAGDVPFITAFTFGEYGYGDDQANACGGLMLSFTGFEK